jgi:hypothetical protein
VTRKLNRKRKITATMIATIAQRLEVVDREFDKVLLAVEGHQLDSSGRVVFFQPAMASICSVRIDRRNRAIFER